MKNKKYKTSVIWTEKEIETLKIEIKRYEGRLKNSWYRISLCFRNKTPADCYKQYKEMQNMKSWKPEEDAYLIKRFKELREQNKKGGRNKAIWSVIAKELNRPLDNCKWRWRRLGDVVKINNETDYMTKHLAQLEDAQNILCVVCEKPIEKVIPLRNLCENCEDMHKQFTEGASNGSSD